MCANLSTTQMSIFLILLNIVSYFIFLGCSQFQKFYLLRLKTMDRKGFSEWATVRENHKISINFNISWYLVKTVILK